MQQKTYVQPGQIVTNTVGYSEAACYTRIAGTTQDILILTSFSGILVDKDGHQIGGPYLLGELGFYSDANGNYKYN